MEKVVRKFASFAEEEEAESAYYGKLSGNERLHFSWTLSCPRTPMRELSNAPCEFVHLSNPKNVECVLVGEREVS